MQLTVLHANAAFGDAVLTNDRHPEQVADEHSGPFILLRGEPCGYTDRTPPRTPLSAPPPDTSAELDLQPLSTPGFRADRHYGDAPPLRMERRRLDIARSVSGFEVRFRAG